MVHQCPLKDLIMLMHKAYSNYEEIDGGFVACGGNSKEGKITGKGIIRTAKLDFEDVYFVKELKFNLFSVSQMCDKKDSVLFNDTNVIPQVGLTCLFVKATSDESDIWHRRLGHVNFKSRKPTLSFMRPFGCHVTILSTLDHLGKFDRKANEGIFVGYSTNSKAFRVFNSRTRIVEENLHVKFSENTPNIAGSGPNWLFDIDALTKSINYKTVVTGNQSNGSAGIKPCDNVGKTRMEIVPNKDYILLPLWTQDPLLSSSSKDSPGARFKPSEEEEKKDAKDPGNEDSKNNVVDKNIVYGCADDPNMLDLEEIGRFSDAKNDDSGADMNNLDTYFQVSHVPITRIHKDHPLEQFIRDLHSAPQTMRMSKNLEGHGLVLQALKDPSWIESMQEELLQFKLQEVWTLVDLPYGKRAIGSKWVFRNKVDERGIVIRNKARIEVISLFIAYASFKDFVVYQMDVKSAYLYEKIKEEEMCTEFEKMMHKKFQMSFIGELTFFLRLQVKQKEDGIFISQDKYVNDILIKFSFFNVKIASTPMDTHKILLKDEKGEDLDEHMFFRDLKGQPKLGLWYPKDSPFDIEAYTDSDYTGASLDRKSTTGGCQFLGCRLILWQCKKQPVVANSIIEARHHFIKDSNEKKLTQMIKIHTDKNVADLLTKAFDTGKVKNINEEAQLHAKVDGKKVVISEASTRRYFQFQDEEEGRKRLFWKGNTSISNYDGSSSRSNSGGDRIQLKELMELCTNLQQRVFDLETTKISQAQEITSLKKRVKRLENKRRSRTYGLKILYKVGLSTRVESSVDEESLDKEGLSKQGRISDIDSNQDIYLVNVHRDEYIFGVNDQDDTSILAEEEAQKALEANIVVIEQWHDVQAKIDADYELAQRLQAEEKEQLTDAERARLFMEFLEKRKKFFVAKRNEEKRNRPPTIAQKTSIMENSLITQEASGSLEDLEIIQEEDTHPSIDTSVNHEVDDLEIDEPQNDIIPIRSKWLFKKKTGMDGALHTYKDRLMAKGYTQTPGIDYEKTLSPVTDIRAIRILISTCAFYDYEIWQMDVKTAFLNGYLSEEVYIEQHEGFVNPKYTNRVCKLKRSIYRLNQASKQRNKQFNDEIKKFGFTQNHDEPCVHLKAIGSNITFLILYVDDILIMGNNISMLQDVKSYLGRYHMENSKHGSIPMQGNLRLGKSQGASTPAELKRMQIVKCTRPDVAFAQNITSQFQQNLEAEYIAAYDASKEAVWVRKFISRLGVVPIIEDPINMYCDKTRAITIANESGITKGARHFHAKVLNLNEVI
nr:hypothetical protein [Tanacetum cinerariifolium]